MLHEAEYDSDTSDEDYVPAASTEGGAESADEASSGEEHKDGDFLEEENSVKKKKSKTVTKGRKKKGNPLLSQVEAVEDSPLEEEAPQDLETNKKAEDDVWASFLEDVGEEEKKPSPPRNKPKAKSWAELLGKKKPKESSVPSTEASSSVSQPKPSSTTTTTTATKKKDFDTKVKDTVKITKIFEFAGEEIKVEEEVSSQSSEAIAAQNQTNPSGGVKRSGLAGLVNSLGQKRQKLSTLEKTKLDWQSYKQQEGLAEELLLHTKSKDTFIDKQEFLQRADQRQFEIERDVRLGVRRSNR